jgi:hypothetical protein
MSEADQEPNRGEPIQPNNVSDGTAGVAVSLPLNKERSTDTTSTSSLTSMSAIGMPCADCGALSNQPGNQLVPALFAGPFLLERLNAELAK